MASLGGENSATYNCGASRRAAMKQIVGHPRMRAGRLHFSMLQSRSILSIRHVNGATINELSFVKKLITCSALCLTGVAA